MKGILFKPELIVAISEGRKTMTRRLIKPQPPEAFILQGMGTSVVWETALERFAYFKNILGTLEYNYRPKYQIGETVYLKETYFKGTELDDAGRSTGEDILVYKSDTGDRRPCNMSDELCLDLFGDDKKGWPKWQSPLMMPEKYARYFIKITDIKCERASEISEQDAIAEGIKPQMWYDEAKDKEIQMYENYRDVGYTALPAQKSFESLWNKINGSETWDHFVFAYTFELTSKPN